MYIRESRDDTQNLMCAKANNRKASTKAKRAIDLLLDPLLGLLLDSPLVCDLVVPINRKISIVFRPLRYRKRDELEHGVRLDLRRVGSVGIVQQVLDPQKQLQNQRPNFKKEPNQPLCPIHCHPTTGGVPIAQRFYRNTDLFDGNSRFPSLFFVKDGQADGPRGINVGVKERGREFTCGRV